MTDDLAKVDINRLIAPQLRKIAATIGLPDTLKLLRKRGGTKTHVPQGPEARLFPDVLEDDKARNLARLFTGHQYLTLPKADKILQELRDQQIRAEVEQGRKLQAQALHYQLTERQILNIRRGDRGDKFRSVRDVETRRELQTDLFDSATPNRARQ
ncbi:Mor transcription activator family protein [Stagnimonas aquatica]|uniref:Mor transcription activator family protein n=1 Tax=Stagnimonas aquatica TaxID=2689987 RepID=UPI00131579E3|nr:Mor transcription activator family protein [Stagnimonas aquatica]